MLSHGYNNRGITLIELLVVVLIIGILAAVAIPGYSSYMVRARRVDAKTALEHVRAAQEMWRAEKGKYSVDQGELQTTMGAPATTISPYYIWNFLIAGDNAFTAQAIPTGSQPADEALFINHLGQKWDVDNVFYPDRFSRWTR
jgi:type IV pilus assembly protein PilE